MKSLPPVPYLPGSGNINNAVATQQTQNTNQLMALTSTSGGRHKKKRQTKRNKKRRRQTKRRQTNKENKKIKE